MLPVIVNRHSAIVVANLPDGNEAPE